MQPAGFEGAAEVLVERPLLGGERRDDCLFALWLTAVRIAIGTAEVQTASRLDFARAPRHIAQVVD